MARTTQTVRKAKPSTASQRNKKTVAKERIVQTHKFANCSRCAKSLSHWGKGNTNGHTCPPCSQAMRREDLQKRRAITEKRGIHVDVQGVVRVVDLDTFSESKEIAPVTCQLYRLASYYGECTPLYECRIDDCALFKYGANVKAHWVAGGMGCFDLRDDVCGPALFTGPDRTSLFPHEIQRYLHV